MKSLSVPSHPASPSVAALLARAEWFLESQATRLVFSFLIILSVLPAKVLDAVLPSALAARLDLVLLVVFSGEFALRAAVYARRVWTRRQSGWELALLLADLVALVSFLPLRELFPSFGHFRLFRLTRLLLLFGYWGGMVRDLWAILTASDRRYQVVVVLLLGLVLSFTGTVIIEELAPAHDFNEDGQVNDADLAFPVVLWWAFRQVQDSGNLLTQPTNALVVVVSLLLTFSGVLLFSFVIGIGTGAMDEVMRRSRDRPVGLRGHTAILGLGPYAFYLLEELAEIYRKNRKRLRAAVLGPTEEAPRYLRRRALRPYRYRHGETGRVADLDRVDVDSAKRVLILGQGADPDASVIAAILAARTRTSQATLYPDLEHEKNVGAARAAGGPRTRIIESGPFLGYYLAQNAIHPGVYRIYRQMLTTAGCEIYTYLFGETEQRAMQRNAGTDGGVDLPAWFDRAFREHAVTLLGVFTTAGDEPLPDVQDLDLLLNPTGDEARRRVEYAWSDGRLRLDRLRGLVAVCARWRDLADFGRALVATPGGAPLTRDPAGFADLALELPAARARRVLVCGSSLRVPRVVSELVRYYGDLEVTILVRDETRIDALAADVQAALDGALAPPGVGAVREPWTARDATDHGETVLRGPRGEACLRILHVDWTDAARILRHPAADLRGADVVLFLPSESTENADGLVALDCLRLAQFHATGAVTLRPGLRVVGMLRDPVKSDLLERRLDESSGPGAESRFTIISSERVRHHFVVQNLFVPGLSAVFTQMMDASGEHLCRFVPRARDGGMLMGEFEPYRLVQHLLLDRGLLPMGFETVSAEGRVRVQLDPRDLAPGARWDWSSVRAVYALGEGGASAPSA